MSKAGEASSAVIATEIEEDEEADADADADADGEEEEEREGQWFLYVCSFAPAATFHSCSPPAAKATMTLST